MYAVSRQYQVDPGAVDEIARRVERGFVPIISAVPGFVSYSLNDWGAGSISTFSVFQDKAGAEASVAKAASWVRERLAALIPSPPEVTTYEVRFRDVMPGRRPTIGVARIYQGVDPANVDETLRRVRGGLLPILRGVPGFVSYAGLDQGNGTIGSASSFTDQAAADESSRRAVDWVRANLSDLLPSPPQVQSSRMLVRHAVD
jgi:hypothetical protein